MPGEWTLRGQQTLRDVVLDCSNACCHLGLDSFRVEHFLFHSSSCVDTASGGLVGMSRLRAASVSTGLVPERFGNLLRCKGDHLVQHSATVHAVSRLDSAIGLSTGV